MGRKNLANGAVPDSTTSFAKSSYRSQKAKKNKAIAAVPDSTTTFANLDYEYGRIVKVMTNGRVKAMTLNGELRLCHTMNPRLRLIGKMAVGDYVKINYDDFEDDVPCSYCGIREGDVIQYIKKDDEKVLVSQGIIPSPVPLKNGNIMTDPAFMLLYERSKVLERCGQNDKASIYEDIQDDEY